MAAPALPPGPLPGRRRARRSVLPGFGLSLGYSVLYLGLLVLLPMAALVLKAAAIGPAQFWAEVSEPRVVAALQLSFGAALVASLVNVVLGLLIGWTLVRHPFPGWRLADALIDLPFALPTAVAGITLTTLLAPNGWVGKLLEPLGIKAAYTPLGVVIALTFIGLPFVVRAVQPVLQNLTRDAEEAALTLGATGSQIFWRVLLPELRPALITGFALALARTVGEYGSVVFISGNLPFRTEIGPLVIVQKLDEYDYGGAAAVAVVMLAVSLALLVATNAYGAWAARRLGTA